MNFNFQNKGTGELSSLVQSFLSANGGGVPALGAAQLAIGAVNGLLDQEIGKRDRVVKQNEFSRRRQDSYLDSFSNTSQYYDAYNPFANAMQTDIYEKGGLTKHLNIYEHESKVKHGTTNISHKESKERQVKTNKRRAGTDLSDSYSYPKPAQHGYYQQGGLSTVNQMLDRLESRVKFQQGGSKSKSSTKLWEGAYGRYIQERNADAKIIMNKFRQEQKTDALMNQSLMPQPTVQDSQIQLPIYQDSLQVQPAFKHGGTHYSPNGYYDNPYADQYVVPTDGRITMRNVPVPMYGTSLNTGERKKMLPNKDYYFKNTNLVIENKF